MSVTNGHPAVFAEIYDRASQSYNNYCFVHAQHMKVAIQKHDKHKEDYLKKKYDTFLFQYSTWLKDWQSKKEAWTESNLLQRMTDVLPNVLLLFVGEFCVAVLRERERQIKLRLQNESLKLFAIVDEILLWVPREARFAAASLCRRSNLGQIGRKRSHKIIAFTLNKTFLGKNQKEIMLIRYGMLLSLHKFRAKQDAAGIIKKTKKVK